MIVSLDKVGAEGSGSLTLGLLMTDLLLMFRVFRIHRILFLTFHVCNAEIVLTIYYF